MATRVLLYISAVCHISYPPYRLRFLYYLFQMVVLTFALAIAARPELTDDQMNLYPAPIDYFRGICEGILIIMMVAKVVDEIVEFAL